MWVIAGVALLSNNYVAFILAHCQKNTFFSAIFFFTSNNQMNWLFDWPTVLILELRWCLGLVWKLKNFHLSLNVAFNDFTASAVSTDLHFCKFPPVRSCTYDVIAVSHSVLSVLLAAVWLTGRVLLPGMNEGRAHLSYQSVNVTASCQKASVSRLKTALCSLRGRTPSQKQTPRGQIVALCVSSRTHRRWLCCRI